MWRVCWIKESNQQFLGDSSSICVSTLTLHGLYPSEEHVYDYTTVFVVTALGYLYNIHLEIHNGTPLFWVCNFGLDYLQTNFLYCCRQPPFVSVSHHMAHISKRGQGTSGEIQQLPWDWHKEMKCDWYLCPSQPSFSSPGSSSCKRRQFWKKSRWGWGSSSTKRIMTVFCRGTSLRS